VEHYREDERADTLNDVRTAVRLYNNIEVHDYPFVILVVRRTSHLLHKFNTSSCNMCTSDSHKSSHTELISRLRAPSKLPRIPTRTKKYQSFVSSAIAHYQ